MHELEPPVGALIAETPLSRQVETRNKAAELFARRGFGQVSMRELAAHVGIQPGSLYNHFESKESLLFDLIEEIYETLLATAAHQRDRYQEADSQWQATIDAHLALHQQKGVYFWVAEHEYRNLSQSHLKKAQFLRQRYEEHLLSLLIQAGVPASPLLQSVVQGIVSLLNILPSLFEHSLLSKADRLKLTAEVAYGSVAGALKAALPSGFEISSRPKVIK